MIICISKPPALINPANNSTNILINPNLSWNTSANATSYILQVSTSNAFSSCVVNQTGISGTASQVTGLDYNTQYFWRVQAVNATDISEWSEVWQFTTEDATSVQENNEQLTVNISPNPANDIINVAFNNPISYSNIAIYNIYGQKVLVSQIFGNDLQVDVSHLSAGVYFIRIGSRTQAFIKQ